MSRLYIKELIPAKTYVDGIKAMIKRIMGYGYGFPENCGYFDGHTLFGDCWCTHPKSFVWSIFAGIPIWENYKTGAYFYLDKMYQNGAVIKADASSGLPDWGGYQLLDGYCDDISFREMRQKNITPCLIGTPDHMGCYFGDISVNGYIYNTHEMTPNGYISPYMLSYVDDNGYCYNHKDGTYIRKWSRACKMTGIIDYSDTPTPTPTPQPTKPWSLDNVAVYCIRGSIPDGTKVPTGLENRIDFFGEYGYTEAEVRQAQDIINAIYYKRDMDLLAVNIAMQFIGGIRDADGNLIDGVTRRLQWVAETFPDYDAEKLFRLAQDKVNWYAEK